MSSTYFVAEPILPSLLILGTISSPMFHWLLLTAPEKLVAVIVPAAKSPLPSLTTALLAVFVLVNTVVSVKSTANVLSAVKLPPPLIPAPELIFLFCSAVILPVLLVTTPAMLALLPSAAAISPSVSRAGSAPFNNAVNSACT